MAVNFSTLVYLPNYDTFARAVTITPLASQPGMRSRVNKKPMTVEKRNTIKWQNLRNCA